MKDLKDRLTVDWVRIEARQRRMEQWVKDWAKEIEAEEREHERLLNEKQTQTNLNLRAV